MILNEKPPAEASFHGFPSEEEFLEHYGVPGMRWGFRKAEDVGPGRRPAAAKPAKKPLSSRNQKAVTAAFAIGVVVVGAVLLKRGNIKVADARSAKIALSGARMSANILGKTGKVLVKTGAKSGKVAGKVGLKGGKLLGKVGSKASVATAKGAASGLTKAGQKTAEGVLKGYGSSVKLGSNLMFKLTGKGTPVVKETVKQSRNLNMVDLLLNTRADTFKKK